MKFMVHLFATPCHMLQVQTQPTQNHNTVDISNYFFNYIQISFLTLMFVMSIRQ
jgi:hypothetical protein